ncbi:hypothetical protein BD414DRAFT_171788 [Trametes punicea]|nr:hypothetical protein BD414DRAFT_171788 [Trametes punicea]
MQLGATKVPSSVSSIPDWAEEAAAEVETSQNTNPWGNDDLMDVNADDDDWSAFETAPAPTTEGSGLGFGNVAFQSTTTPAVTAGSWAAPTSTKPSACNEWGSPPPTLAPQASRASTSSRSGPSATLASPRPSSILRSPTPSDSGKIEATPPASTTHSMAGMTKEEKAAEMARRKEERRQRIAALKEQKKHAAEAKT